jgi:hypothetical protein
VLAELDRVAAVGGDATVSGIARAACVDRTFLYRHPDLLALVRALEEHPARGDAQAAHDCPTCGCPRDDAALQQLRELVDGLQRQIAALSVALGTTGDG